MTKRNLVTYRHACDSDAERLLITLKLESITICSEMAPARLAASVMRSLVLSLSFSFIFLAKTCFFSPTHTNTQDFLDLLCTEDGNAVERGGTEPAR